MAIAMTTGYMVVSGHNEPPALLRLFWA